MRYHRAKILIATKQYAVSVVVSLSAPVGHGRLIDLPRILRGVCVLCRRVTLRYYARTARAHANAQAAVADLKHLRDTSPDESNVLFQLAKAYRLLGDEVKFAQLLAEVRDLAPKSAAKIRKLVDTVKDGDVGEEVMDEG